MREGIELARGNACRHQHRIDAVLFEEMVENLRRPNLGHRVAQDQEDACASEYRHMPHRWKWSQIPI
jgi:predicted DNA-binding protein (UPF0278 family)